MWKNRKIRLIPIILVYNKYKMHNTQIIRWWSDFQPKPPPFSVTDDKYIYLTVSRAHFMKKNKKEYQCYMCVCVCTYTNVVYICTYT